MSSEKILKKVSLEFQRDTFFMPRIGAEIEFYLIGEVSSDFLYLIKDEFNKSSIEIVDAKEEDGKGQYEISLQYSDNPVQLAENICKAQKIVQKMADKLGVKADFSAKPFPDDFGSALHIHVSLLDNKGENQLAKTDDAESEVMQHAVGGLLFLMKASCKYFAPYENCYKRFTGGSNSPAKISWGGNNRTVSLRLPATTTDPDNRRIEHRVSSPDANPYEVIACILIAMSYGIVNKINPSSEKIYGDASLDQYELEDLPQSLQEAKEFCDKSIDGYFN